MADLREIDQARREALGALWIVQRFNPASFASPDVRAAGMVPNAACLVHAFLRFPPDMLQGLEVQDLQLLKGLAEEVGNGFKAVDDPMLKRQPAVFAGHLRRLCDSVIPQLREIEGRHSSIRLTALRDLQRQTERELEQFRGQTSALGRDAERAMEALRRGIADIEAKRKDAESALEEMRQVQKGVEALLGEIRAVTADTKEKAAAAVAEAGEGFRKEAEFQRQTLAREGVNRQSAFFKREAQKHEKASRGWGVGAALAALVLLLYAVWGDGLVAHGFPENPNDEWTPGLVYITVRVMITRLLVFAVLGYALFFCARNYTAHRHNAVVNRHRRNALATYRMLARANANPESADIILTQAARFIYAPQDSGYGRGGGADGGDVSVFETVRRAADLVKKPDKDS